MPGVAELLQVARDTSYEYYLPDAVIFPLWDADPAHATERQELAELVYVAMYRRPLADTGYCRHSLGDILVWLELRGTSDRAEQAGTTKALVQEYADSLPGF